MKNLDIKVQAFFLTAYYILRHGLKGGSEAYAAQNKALNSEKKHTGGVRCISKQ